MAVLDSNEMNSRGTATNAAHSPELEGKAIADIMAAKDDRDQTYDPEANAFERLATVVPGVYGVKLYPSKDGFKLTQNPRNPNEINYSTVVEAKIVDVSFAPSGAEQFQDMILGLPLSTMVGKGRKTSTMATLMAKMGVKVQNITKVLKLAQTLQQWLVQKEPTVYVEVDWRASYKESDDPSVKDWKNLYNSWEQFPKDLNGEPMERFEYASKTGPRVVVAQAQIKDVFGTVANVPNEKKHRAGGAKPAQPVTRVAATSAPVSNAAPVAAANAGGGATEDLFGNL